MKSNSLDLTKYFDEEMMVLKTVFNLFKINFMSQIKILNRCIISRCGDSTPFFLGKYSNYFNITMKEEYSE